MNTSLFLTLLNELSDSDWQSVLNGKGLCIIEDQQLQLCLSEEPDMIVLSDVIDANTADALKQQVIHHADDLLSRYYRSHPLSNTGFNSQVEKLVNLHGHEAFIGASGQPSALTLFVEGGEVVVESADSPKHPYGVFMECDKTLPSDKRKAAFTQWLSSGEAYRQYIGMNVCRYNC